MAKVIRIDKTKAKRKTHNDCGAVVEYFETEVQSYTKTDYGGGTDIYYYIICPNCSGKIVWS
jgi:hypothetical protein